MSWPDAPRFDEFKAIRVPTLVLRGGDPKSRAMDAGASLAKKLKHARVVTIPMPDTTRGWISPPRSSKLSWRSYVR